MDETVGTRRRSRPARVTGLVGAFRVGERVVCRFTGAAGNIRYFLRDTARKRGACVAWDSGCEQLCLTSDLRRPKR